MRVLVNAGPWLPVPPGGYGGIESFVATLVPELRAAGVHVVLAAAGPSTLEADDYVRPLDQPRFSSIAAPYNQVSGIAHAHMAGVVRALQERAPVDLVHDHLEVVGPAVLAAMGDGAPPALQTLHWDLRKHAEFYSAFDGRGRVAFAAVSTSQLERAPEALRRQTIGVVPLAVPAPPASPGPRGAHVLVLARITRDKGQDVAVRLARRAGIELVLAGPVAGVDDPEQLAHRIRAGDAGLAAHPDVRFFVDEVAPHLDGERVRWVGGVGGADKEQLLSTARALLTPIRWAEPGAIAVVEALVRGVPVIGTRMGVLPSLVEHGVTGFLADDEDGLLDGLERAATVDPEACRAAAVPWTPAAMARSYIDLYERLLAQVRPR